MNTLPRTLALAIALVSLVLSAACGAEDDSSATTAQSSTSSDDATSSTAPDHTVTSVTVRRSGGKTGGVLTRTFTAGEQPPDGYDAAQQTQVITVAQQVVDADVRVPELPANTCCDRYLYTVVIGFADGTSTTLTVLDGERTPAAFQDLLTQLS